MQLNCQANNQVNVHGQTPACLGCSGKRSGAESDSVRGEPVRDEGSRVFWRKIAYKVLPWFKLAITGAREGRPGGWAKFSQRRAIPLMPRNQVAPGEHEQHMRKCRGNLTHQPFRVELTRGLHLLKSVNEDDDARPSSGGEILDLLCR